MLQRQFSSYDITVFEKKVLLRGKNYDLWDDVFLLFLTIFTGSRYFVAGTVCKSSAHDATLKIGVILSPLHPWGGVTWVNFCWVCAAGLSEPLPHYRPHVSPLGKYTPDSYLPEFTYP